MPPIARFFSAAAVLSALVVAGCTSDTLESAAVQKSPRADYAVQNKLASLASSRGMAKTAPIMMRIFKEENTLEVWKQRTDGRYALISSYPMCRWSGKLGPKFTEGDRQAPEGFYNITPGQMNPGSKFYLAFNMGYPNAYDRANGRSGAHLMVHGSCSSAGCYSLTDGQMQEVYALAKDAFSGGQKSFQVQAFPFRMTPANMARYRSDPNIEFWKMLKEGYDRFEIARTPPKVDVCGKRYVFNKGINADGTAGNACAAQSTPVADSAYQSYQAAFASEYSKVETKSDLPAPRSSIQGTKEAAVVADWSKKRGRGERVSLEPPSMRADGTVVATAKMGRIDSEVGRQQAAREAKEAEEKRIAEAKRLEAERVKAEAEQRKIDIAAKQKAIKDAQAFVKEKMAEEQKQAKAAGKDGAAGKAPAVDAKAKPAESQAQEVVEAPVAVEKPENALDAVKNGMKNGAKKFVKLFGG